MTTDQRVVLAEERGQRDFVRDGKFDLELPACVDATGPDKELLGIQGDCCEDFTEHAGDKSIVAFLQLGALDAAIPGLLS
jgi:hypothetical protein